MDVTDQLPEPGRQAAHVLLDAITGLDATVGRDANLAAMNVALGRLNSIDDAVIATFDEDTRLLSVEVDNIVSGAVVCLSWLVHELANARGTDPLEPIAELRTFLG